MTDTRIESWLDERRRIHAAAGLKSECVSDRGFVSTKATGAADWNGPLDDREAIAESWTEGGAAIADALNALPAFIRMVEAVLKRHRPIEVEPSNTICGGCSHRLPNGRYMPVVEYPCETVRALEAVIGDES